MALWVVIPEEGFDSPPHSILGARMSTCPNCKYKTTKHLTKCESETLRFLMLGMTYKQIGSHLFKSPKTIVTFWYRARDKLGVSSLLGVFQKWTTLKMIEVPDMKESVEFRAGYSQALADLLSPDMELFKNDQS
jgi:DNA-binding CsgD family transcriptional regulator